MTYRQLPLVGEGREVAEVDAERRGPEGMDPEERELAGMDPEEREPQGTMGDTKGC